MRPAAKRPHGFFVVRAWMESADPTTFRARITHTTGSGTSQTESAVSSPTELGEKAKWWAEELIASHG